MPKRSCKWPGCPNYTEHRYCERHEQRGEKTYQEYQALWDKTTRDTTAKQFYRSKAWQALRNQVIGEQPVCNICNDNYAYEVDHIIPRKDAPHLELERSNCQALCKWCHSIKSASERKAKGKTT